MTNQVFTPAAFACAFLCAALGALPAQTPTSPEKPEKLLEAPRAARNQGINTTPRALMGIMMKTVDDSLAEQLGLCADDVVVVDSVTSGFGAEKAGIKKHDVITSIDGKTPVTIEMVQELFRSKKPGDKVKVKVARAKGDKEFVVELKAAGSGDEATPGAVGQESRVAPSDPLQGVPYLNRLFTTSGHLDHAKLRAQLEEASKHIADAQALLSKQTQEMTRDYAKLVEELAQKAKAKVEGLTDGKRLQDYQAVIERHLKQAQQRIETDWKPRIEAHVRALERLLKEQHGKDVQPGIYSSADGRDKYVVVDPRKNPGQGGGAGGGQGLGLLNIGRAPGADNAPGGGSGGVQKSLDQVCERLGAIEERLERIEALLKPREQEQGDRKKKDN